MPPFPARRMAGSRHATRSKNGLSDGTDQPSADGSSLRHDKNSENELAEQLIEQTGDKTLALMDKGYYSLGQLNA